MRFSGSAFVGSGSGSKVRVFVLRAFAASWLALFAVSLNAQVTFDRLVRASQEPHNWLSYSGGYFSQRYSELAQITPDNVKNLEPAWIYQLTSREPTSTRFEVTPVVVDGVMYIVQPPNDIIALDAVTGPSVLDVLVQPVAAGAALLRPVESRRRDSSETGCSWARSTATWSPSMRKPESCSGTRRS